MHFDSEKELASAIFDNWMLLRKRGHMDEVLPRPKGHRQAGKGGSRRFYEMREHRLLQEHRIPGAGPKGGDGRADAVEVYFSPSPGDESGWDLHINVIELKNEALRLPHMTQLFRYVTGIRAGIEALGMSLWTPSKPSCRPRQVYVSGALLGMAVTDDVLAVEATMTEQSARDFQAGIRVGLLTTHGATSFIAKRSPSPYARMGATATAAQLKNMMHGSPLWAQCYVGRKRRR